MIDGAQLYAEWVRSGQREKAFWRAHYADVLTYGAFHGKLWRAKADREHGAIIYLDKPDIEPEPPPVSLNDLNDRARWRSALNALLTNKPIVRVMHLCDLHEPFSDPDVKEAALALVQLVQPDIIVRGSDEDDLPTISAWAEDGAEEPDIGDFLDTMQMSRNYNTRRLKTIAPRALQVNIEGNHGYPRFIKWVNKKARQAKDTLLRRYIENVRCNGSVFFIGFKQSVRIHENFVVMHGRKWGNTAAKQTLELRANAVSITAGHSHKPQAYSTVGKQAVTCYISGCLCQIPAHHNADEDDEYCNWQHSTVVTTLDTETGEVDMKDVRFHKSDSRVWFEWGGVVYRQAAAAKARAAA